MSTYKAWDGNDYPSPPPDGWYQASDGLWWPEGYGPGPVAAEPTPAEPVPVEPTPAPAPAPAPSFEAPQAVAPAFDRDPTTVMPTAPGPGPAPGAQADGGAIPGHAMPAPGNDPSPPASFDPPAADSWSKPPGGGPSGFETPGAPAGEWSQPPAAAPPPVYDTLATGGGSSNKGRLIAAAALLGLVVLGGLAFALSRGGDDGGEAVAFDPTAVKGSAANPHTAGDLVRISYDDPDGGGRTEWTIEVTESPIDTLADGGNDADATVRLRVGLSESDGAKNLSTLTFTAVSPDGDRTSSGSCAALSSPLPEDRLVSVGETAEGQVCWRVPTADLPALTMMVEVDGIDGAVHLELQ